VKDKKFISLLAIVAANLVPLVMVLLGRWGVGEVLLLYWLETGIVGVFTILKVLFARAPLPAHKPLTLQQIKGMPSAQTLPIFLADWGLLGKALLSLFFSFPYILLMALQGFILYIFLAVVGSYGWPLQAVRWGFVWLFASHAFSFVVDYLISGESLRTSPEQCVETPYHRLAILQIALGGGGWLAHQSGHAAYVMSLFVIAKIVIDLRPAKGYI
jgi:hypothetical protein